MVEVITLEMLLELPRALIRKAEEYNDYAVLLDKEQYSMYDYKTLKEEVSKYFNYFKDLKFCYQFSTTYISSSTNVYNDMNISPSNQISDPVFKTSVEELESLNWMTNFYNRILIIASKLTIQEATYLVDCFFSNKSEEVTCEKLRICRNTLQKVKKSCLIKTWVELKTLKLPKKNI